MTLYIGATKIYKMLCIVYDSGVKEIQNLSGTDEYIYAGSSLAPSFFFILSTFFKQTHKGGGVPGCDGQALWISSET